MQGGVAFVINKSSLKFHDTKLLRNLAQDGATIFGIANQDVSPMVIESSIIKDNWGE
jgi:hypothetical protein